ncbi:unnamed protein product [Cochlearia groenlandica]
MILTPCASKTTKDGDSTKSQEAAAADPMEFSSSVFNPCLKKRKAEFDPEPEEEEQEEEEEEEEEKPKSKEAEFDIVTEPPEWDVDSFDGLEYVSSSSPTEVLLSDEKSSNDEEAMASYRFSKRQIIESKGFYLDPERKLICRYKGIKPMNLDKIALRGKTYREYWQEMVHLCIQKHNQEKNSPPLEFVEVVRGNYRAGGARARSYITFMAREKPGERPVEYQAKCMCTVDGKRHPILCRLTTTTTTPKPSDQDS